MAKKRPNQSAEKESRSSKEVHSGDEKLDKKNINPQLESSCEQPITDTLFTDNDSCSNDTDPIVPLDTNQEQVNYTLLTTVSSELSEVNETNSDNKTNTEVLSHPESISDKETNEEVLSKFSNNDDPLHSESENTKSDEKADSPAKHQDFDKGDVHIVMDKSSGGFHVPSNETTTSEVPAQSTEVEIVVGDQGGNVAHVEATNEHSYSDEDDSYENTDENQPKTPTQINARETSFSEEDDNEVGPGRLRRRGGRSSSEEDEEYEEDFSDSEEMDNVSSSSEKMSTAKDRYAGGRGNVKKPQEDITEDEGTESGSEIAYSTNEKESAKESFGLKDEAAKNDKKNPANVPKNGRYYMHEDREEESGDAKDTQAPRTERPGMLADRWSHDKYDYERQAPKTEKEIISRHGYNVRMHGLDEEVKFEEARQKIEETKQQQQSELRMNRKEKRKSFKSDPYSQLDDSKSSTTRSSKLRPRQKVNNDPKNDLEIVHRSSNHPSSYNQKNTEQQERQKYVTSDSLRDSDVRCTMNRNISSRQQPSSRGKMHDNVHRSDYGQNQEAGLDEGDLRHVLNQSRENRRPRPPQDHAIHNKAGERGPSGDANLRRTNPRRAGHNQSSSRGNQMPQQLLEDPFHNKAKDGNPFDDVLVQKSNPRRGGYSRDDYSRHIGPTGQSNNRNSYNQDPRKQYYDDESYITSRGYRHGHTQQQQQHKQFNNKKQRPLNDDDDEYKPDSRQRQSYHNRDGNDNAQVNQSEQNKTAQNDTRQNDSYQQQNEKPDSSYRDDNRGGFRSYQSDRRGESRTCQDNTRGGYRPYQDNSRGVSRSYRDGGRGGSQTYHDDSRGEYRSYHDDSRGEYRSYQDGSRGGSQAYHDDGWGGHRSYQDDNRGGSRSYQHGGRIVHQHRRGGYRPRITSKNDEDEQKYDEDYGGDDFSDSIFEPKFQDAGCGKRYSTNRNKPKIDRSLSNFSRSDPVASMSNSRQCDVSAAAPLYRPPPQSQTTSAAANAPSFSSSRPMRTGTESPAGTASSPPKCSSSAPPAKPSPTSQQQPVAEPVKVMMIAQAMPPSMPIAYAQIPSHQQPAPPIMEPSRSAQEFMHSIDQNLVTLLLNQQPDQMYQQQQHIITPLHPQAFPIGPTGDGSTYFDPHSGMPVNPHGMAPVFNPSPSPYQAPDSALHHLPQSGPPPAGRSARPILGSRPKRSLAVRDPPDVSPRQREQPPPLQQQPVQIN